MVMAVILVMWPGSFEQSFVPPSKLRLHVKLIGPVVSEEKMFEERGPRRAMDDRGLPILYDEPSARMS